MRWALALFLLAAVAAPANEPPSLQVTTHIGGGFLCPIGPSEALTARHVAIVTWSRNPADFAVMPVIWGKDNAAIAVNWNWVLDIAYVKSDAPFPYYFNLSPIDPQVGDTVYLDSYDNNHGRVPKTMKTEISGFNPGLIVLKDTPGPGSSGSCIFNSEHEVIGINFGGIVKDEYGNVLGMAVLTTPKIVEGLKNVPKEDK